MTQMRFKNIAFLFLPLFFLNLILVSPGAKPLSFLSPQSAAIQQQNGYPDVVIALGGNAFKPTNGIEDYWESLRESARIAAVEIAQLIHQGKRVVITHGNGPQVGKLLQEDPATSLAKHVETTQDHMGRLLKEELGAELARLNGTNPKTISVLNTRVIVDPNDPAFNRPTKPIGWFTEEVARKLEIEMKKKNSAIYAKKFKDKPNGWRLVVPSPQPVGISNLTEVKQRIAAGEILIIAGGGGIPVDMAGNLQIAVIDKDRASGMASIALKAKLFMILTAVKQVAENFDQPNEYRYNFLTQGQVQRLKLEKKLGEGSMLPKVESAEKARQADISAVITALGNIGNALKKLDGEATWFHPRQQTMNQTLLRISPYHERSIQMAL